MLKVNKHSFDDSTLSLIHRRNLSGSWNLSFIVAEAMDVTFFLHVWDPSIKYVLSVWRFGLYMSASMSLPPVTISRTHTDRLEVLLCPYIIHSICVHKLTPNTFYIDKSYFESNKWPLLIVYCLVLAWPAASTTWYRGTILEEPDVTLFMWLGYFVLYIKAVWLCLSTSGLLKF